MGFDTRFGFMAFTKFNSDLSGQDLVDHLSIYFDDASEWYEATKRQGGISDDDTTGREFVEAIIFAKESDFVDYELDSLQNDLYALSTECKDSADKGRAYSHRDSPDSFERIDDYDPDAPQDQFDYKIRKEYGEDSFIELDYKSRDPSSPGQIKPDTSRARFNINHNGDDYSLWMRWKESR